MSGSKTKFIYNSDTRDGLILNQKLVNLDESNTRALGFVPVTAISLGLLPNKQVQKLNGNERYINLIGNTLGGEQITRRLIVPDSDNSFFQNGGNITLSVLTGSNNLTSESVVFTVTSSIGEKRFFTRILDTGLTDGTTGIVPVL